MKKTIYLSGSITNPDSGQPREGWQKDFLEAEARLRAMGFSVINPVDIAQEVDDAFKWRYKYCGGPINSTGEPLRPGRADYIMACLQRMQLNREADMLHGVYVIGDIKEILSYHKPHTQIIAVVHNPLLICALSKNKEVNLIEMTKGYVGKVKRMVKEIIA